MNTVREIEDALRRLSPDEMAAFRQWFAEFDAEMWNRQLENDAAAGKLDELANEALDDLRKGHCTNL